MARKPLRERLAEQGPEQLQNFLLNKRLDRSEDTYTQASLAAMNAILANPVAWAELKTEAAINKTPVLDGLAQASCNAAEALMREIDSRTRAVMPPVGNRKSEIANG